MAALVPFLPECFHQLTADNDSDNNDIIYGWVKSENDAENVVASLNREFTTSFIFWNKYDDTTNWKKRHEPRLVWFQGYRDGRKIPGYVESNTVMVCDHGGNPYQPLSNLKRKPQKEDGDRADKETKRRLKAMRTKKTGCSAKIKTKKWILYEDYAIDCGTPFLIQLAKMRELKAYLASKKMAETDRASKDMSETDLAVKMIATDVASKDMSETDVAVKMIATDRACNEMIKNQLKACLIRKKEMIAKELKTDLNSKEKTAAELKTDLTSKEKTAAELKSDLNLDSQKEAKATSIIMMELPLPAQHTGHDLSTGSCMSRWIHPDVRARIQQLINSGEADVSAKGIMAKTCMIAYASGDFCRPDDISRQHAAPGLVFSVPSDRASQVRYTVSLGAENSMPSCPCPSFRDNFFLPCKHMFAVLRAGKAAWEDLSEKYQGSPYLNPDFDVLTRNVVELSETPAIENYGNEGEEDNDDDIPVNEESPSTGHTGIENSVNEESPSTGHTGIENSVSEESPSTDQTRIENSKSRLRDAVQELTDFTYMCDDKALLDEQTQVILAMVDNMRQAILSQNSFPVHPEFADKVKEGETIITENSLPQEGPSLPKRCKLSELKKGHKNSFQVHIAPSLQFLVGAQLDFMNLKKKRTEFLYRGESLTPLNMATLEGQGWLDDRVINTFLGIITDEQNRGNHNRIFFMPSYVSVQWQQGSYTHLYDKVKLSAFQWVFVPINVNQNHWILMAVNMPDRKVHILDSLPSGDDTTVYVNQWRTFFMQHSQAMGILDVVWEEGGLHSTVQKDCWNCGVFVCMNAMAIVRGVELSRCTAQHTASFRRFMLAALHTKTRTLAVHRKECEMPLCVGASKTVVSCVVCGRWAHRGCCNITPGVAYICVFCEVYSV